MTTTLPAAATGPATAAKPPWWADAVLYQIYIRSFADADGDGVGDLRGIRSRLGHLRALGVDGIWLTPCYPSSGADGGYDVSDYCAIDPELGSLDEFAALVADAERAGLRVVIDLVPNHTSSDHPWFREAVAAPPGSAARARYLFRPGRGADGELPPNDWTSVFGGPAWTRLPDDEWYLHLYDRAQPDLNWRHPEVRAEFHRILRFWLDRGVAGFRIDCAHSLLKHPDLPDVGADAPPVPGTASFPNHPQGDRDEVHEIYRDWHRVLAAYPGDRVLVAEAWVSGLDRLARYVQPDELSQAFNFDFVSAGWDAEAFRVVIGDTLTHLGAVGAPATWVLSNHDVVRHPTRYGGGAAGLRRARAAALLMLALPGNAYLYQGEELGLAEVTDLPEEVLRDPAWERSGHTDRGRDGCRVPMPWRTAGPSLGFGSGPGWLPQPAAWAGLSAEAQEQDPGSTLELYRTALSLRRTEKSLGGTGPLRWLPSPGGSLAFARDPGLVCVTTFATPGPVPVPAYGEVLLSSGPLTDPTLLPPDTTVWYRTTA